MADSDAMCASGRMVEGESELESVFADSTLLPLPPFGG